MASEETMHLGTPHHELGEMKRKAEAFDEERNNHNVDDHNPCPECGSQLVYQEGCLNCPACGYTKC